MLLNNIKVGEFYTVIENRNSCYGMCNDLQKIEGEKVEVLEIDKRNDICIKDNVGETHWCRSVNLSE